MGEKIIGLRQLSIFSRGVGGREGGRYRFVARDTAGREKRDATPRWSRASRPQQSTRRRRRRLENGCTYVARKGLEIFLWNLEGNSSYPEENSFHILYFFHRFFPLHSAVLNRYVSFIRCLRASLSFLPFFLLLSSSSPPFSHLLRRISCSFLAGFSRFGESSVGISGESSRFERLAD